MYRACRLLTDNRQIVEDWVTGCPNFIVYSIHNGYEVLMAHVNSIEFMSVFTIKRVSFWQAEGEANLCGRYNANAKINTAAKKNTPTKLLAITTLPVCILIGHTNTHTRSKIALL